MTASTIEHAAYAASPAVTPATPQLTLDDVSAADERHVRAVSEGEPLRPDPGALGRYASVLYAITGWTVFRQQAEQAEDAAYARNAADYVAEDAERRHIARRRPPAWADED